MHGNPTPPITDTFPPLNATISSGYSTLPKRHTTPSATFFLKSIETADQCDPMEKKKKRKRKEKKGATSRVSWFRPRFERTKGAVDIKPRKKQRYGLSFRVGKSEERRRSLGRGLPGPTRRGLLRMGWLTEHRADWEHP